MKILAGKSTISMGDFPARSYVSHYQRVSHFLSKTQATFFRVFHVDPILSRITRGYLPIFYILGNIGNVIIPTDFHSIIQFVVRSAHIFPLAKTDARLGHAYVDFADESQAEVKLSPLAEPGNWLGVDWVGR